MWWLQFLVFLITLSCTISQTYHRYYEEEPHQSPTVNIPGQGTVIGTIGQTAWSGRQIYKFLGIKYAESTSGVNRFQRPRQKQPWYSPYIATSDPKPCPSFPNINDVINDERSEDVEDCLSLSIHTPSTAGNYPVMVYIHGEFFFDGSSKEAQPDYLLEKDVILVSVQYRLGPFGFLSTQTDKIPGNAAVFDVIEALWWVRRHIRGFGGDGTRITLFGQGSGAAMAHLLTITPILETRLFNNVILQSGSILSPYFTTDEPVKTAENIAQECRCNQLNDINAINDCFLRLKPSELLRGFLAHAQRNEPRGIKKFGGFQVVIGGKTNVLPFPPSELIFYQKHHHYPMMGGVPKNVGSFLFSKIYERIRNQVGGDESIEAYIDVVLRHTLGEEDEFGIWKAIIINDLAHEYQLHNTTLKDLAPILIDVCSNILYKGPLLQAMQANANNLPNSTYLYTFNYEREHHRYYFDPNLSFPVGVSLSDENLYLFPFPPESPNLDESDVQVAKIMVDLWTSFATTGVPQSYQIPDWPSMHLVNGPYLEIYGPNNIDIEQDFVEEFPAASSEGISEDIRRYYPTDY